LYLHFVFQVPLPGDDSDSVPHIIMKKDVVIVTVPGKVVVIYDYQHVRILSSEEGQITNSLIDKLIGI